MGRGSEECPHISQIIKMFSTKSRFQVCDNVNCNDVKETLQTNVTCTANHLVVLYGNAANKQVIIATYVCLKVIWKHNF